MPENPMHVLVGVHTSGKTSVGLRLQRHGFMFFPEIAVDVIAGMRPWSLDASFDETVIGRELERDIELRQQSNPFFVETWHVGNLTYARSRNPSIADRHEEQIRARMREFDPRVYFLDLMPELMRERTKYFISEPDRERAIAFYSEVRTEFFRVFKILEISPAVIDAAAPFEAVVADIVRRERSHCSTSGQRKNRPDGHT
jgi:predicted ATPase